MCKLRRKQQATRRRLESQGNGTGDGASFAVLVSDAPTVGARRSKVFLVIDK